MDGQLISSERRRCGFTQSQLARMLSVTSATIRRWELGQFEPDASNIVKLADIFGCSTDYLLGVSDKRTPWAYLATIAQIQQNKRKQNKANSYAIGKRDLNQSDWSHA